MIKKIFFAFAPLKVFLIYVSTAFTFNQYSYSQNQVWTQTSLDSVLVHDILVYDSADIYAATLHGIYFTSDKGETWVLKNNGLLSEPFKIIKDNSGNLFTAGLGGVFKSSNLGMEWFKISNSIPTSEFYSIAISNNGNLIVGSFLGIYYSSDLGNTWNATNYIGWGIQEIISFGDSSVFATNNTAPYSGLFISSNNGIDWNPNAGFSSISLLNFNNSYLFCGSQFPPGLFISSDSGQSWVSTNYFQDATNITEITYDKDGVVYTSVIIYPGCDVGCDVYKSTDLGLTWNNTGLNGKEIWCLAVDSTGVIYAGTQNEGVYRLDRVVPVELISFRSEINLNNVTLKWKTATELNNYGFFVERLLKTNNDNQNWQSIGFVLGRLTTSEPKEYSYYDQNLLSGKYDYRLKQVDLNGSYQYSNSIEIDLDIPNDFVLLQNYPNPFNSETIIEFGIPRETSVNITVYDIKGEEVCKLLNEKKQPGFYKVKFKGGELGSGVYLYRLFTSDGYSEVKKIALLK